ncbi:predicted protein [Plenodomus lingam JN3]|uniref:Predicted protein n=1 Tax=Leptosphaeria maculans (strain JN3 / isolate v23.1.3 / race Av1-4-5-6-7-8) TaxID=985895 RepID=E5A337_LEPMJ|nr:predicted protein [Plenodomus lingam JN3]CBX98050.1 predicted protein [Plenodomus lingam JN3]
MTVIPKRQLRYEARRLRNATNSTSRYPFQALASSLEICRIRGVSGPSDNACAMLQDAR